MDSISGNEPAHTGFEPSDFFRSFAETVRVIITNPAGFFHDLDRRSSSGNAVIFSVICAVVNFVLAALTYPLNPLMPGEAWLPDGWLVPTLVLSPLLVWIGLYILAAFQHLLLMIFVRPRQRFDATFKVVAYTGAFALLSWIPVVGYLASLYGLYATMLGLKALHETSTARALLAILVPSLIFLASIAWTLWP